MVKVKYMKSPFLDRVNLDLLAKDYWEFSSFKSQDPVVFFETNPIVSCSKNVFEDEWLSKVSSILRGGSVGRVLDIGAGDGRLARRLRSESLEVSCLEPATSLAGLLKEDNFHVIEQKWLDWDCKESFDTLIFNRSFVVCAIEKDGMNLMRSVHKLLRYAPSIGFVVFPPIERLSNPGELESELFSGGLTKPLYTPAIYAFFESGLLPGIEFFSMVEKKEYGSLQECLDKDFRCIEHTKMLRSLVQKSLFLEDNKLFRKRDMVTMVLRWSGR